MLSTQVSIWLLYVWVPTDSDVVTFLQNLKPVMENMSRLIKELEKQLRANVEKSSFDLFFCIKQAYVYRGIERDNFL